MQGPLTPFEVKSIDTKMDDGILFSGKVSYGGGTGDIGSNPEAECIEVTGWYAYSSVSTLPNCPMVFLLGPGQIDNANPDYREWLNYSS